MVELVKYYQSQIERYTIDLKGFKLKRNIVTSLKLISFTSIIYLIYLLISSNFPYSFWGMGLSAAALIILSVIDEKIVKKISIAEELIKILKEEIGYCKGDFSSLETGKEYLSTEHPYTYDLDVFGDESLFQSLNRTVTKGGRDILARNLSILCKDKNEIQERQQAVSQLKNNIEWGHKFRATGRVFKTTNNDNKIIQKWQHIAPFLNHKYLIYIIYAVNLLTITSWILACFDIIPYNIPRIASFSQLIISVILTNRINKQHNSLNGFVKAVGNYFYLVKLIDNENFDSPKLNHLKKILSDKGGALTAFSSLNKILGKLDQRMNIFIMILGDSLYMKNTHHVIALDKWKKRYADNIGEWVNAVNEFDVLISMSNYSYNHPDFTIPKFDKEVIIRGEKLCHPLLRGEKPVSNDFEVKQINNIYIITGANMAGKSTFLRSVGVNFILACSGNVVCSTSFSFTPMDLFTSMRTTDNLAKGTSYFHAELLRLKSLIDMSVDGKPIFIILDEMLKGTNSADKLNGSLKFLRRLLSLPISGLVATHDLTLGELSNEYPDNFTNVCFEITHCGKEIVYDYKLKPGVSKNMNASILLEQMGLI